MLLLLLLLEREHCGLRLERRPHTLLQQLQLHGRGVGWTQEDDATSGEGLWFRRHGRIGGVGADAHRWRARGDAGGTVRHVSGSDGAQRRRRRRAVAVAAVGEQFAALSGEPTRMSLVKIRIEWITN